MNGELKSIIGWKLYRQPMMRYGSEKAHLVTGNLGWDSDKHPLRLGSHMSHVLEYCWWYTHILGDLYAR